MRNHTRRPAFTNDLRTVIVYGYKNRREYETRTGELLSPVAR
jgi:hypothetical protein